MVVPGVALALSPAQRALAEKGLAARRARAETDAIQKAIESATRQHIAETRTRCRYSGGGDASINKAGEAQRARDRRLIIRHVGEELARVAMRDPSGKKKPQATGKALQGPPDQGPGSSDLSKTGEREEVDDGYDEDRFGPVRRPPRQRPPNLWVTVFEKEAADVRQETEQAKRKRLADAAAYRELLAKQETDKQRKMKEERERADAFARTQAEQTAQWKAAERDKQQRRQEQVVEEAKRSEQELRAKHEHQMEEQRRKERNELRVVARYQTQMEEERRRREAAKEAHKAEMALVKQANAKQLELKKEQARREQDEEMALQKEYERKLERQELARQQELASIVAKQSQKVKFALLNVKSAEEKAREDEARALQIQAEVREKEARELARREQLKREGVAKQVLALTQQRQERREKREQEQREEDAYASVCRRELSSWQQGEQAKALALRQRQRAYQSLVTQQMTADERRRASEDKYGMTRLEMALNTQLLARAGVRDPPVDAASR